MPGFVVPAPEHEFERPRFTYSPKIVPPLLDLSLADRLDVLGLLPPRPLRLERVETKPDGKIQLAEILEPRKFEGFGEVPEVDPRVGDFLVCCTSSARSVGPHALATALKTR